MDFIDDYFLDEYGHRFRSEAIFATGRYSTADGYGNVFVILPVGDYEILWSRQVKDLYSKLLEENPELKNCTWMVATGEPETMEPQESIEDLEDEWEEVYGEGKNGEWVFADQYSSYQNDREDAAIDIAENIGFNPDYYIDNVNRVEDIYFNTKNFIVNLQEQKTLFDEEDIEIDISMPFFYLCCEV